MNQVKLDKRSYFEGLCSYFKLGSMIDFGKIDEGRTNQTYRVVTSGQEKYMVRIFGTFDDACLRNELLIQDELRRIGMHTSFMIAAPNGDYTYRSGAAVATVSREIIGKHLVRPASQEECFSVGEVLGCFHASVKPDLLLENQFLFLGEERLKQWWATLPSDKFENEIKNLFSYSQDVVRGVFPEGVLHGDLHADNVILTREQVAILDLQSAGTGKYILDLGRSIADICAVDDNIDAERVRRFLRGYEAQRELNADERSHLVQSIVFGAACVALWACRNELYELAESFVKIGTSAQVLESGKTLFIN